MNQFPDPLARLSRTDLHRRARRSLDFGHRRPRIAARIIRKEHEVPVMHVKILN
jgi:hypothetical protein